MAFYWSTEEKVDSEWVTFDVVVNNSGDVFITATGLNPAIEYSMLQIVMTDVETSQAVAGYLNYDSEIGGFDGDVNIRVNYGSTYEIYFNIERLIDGSVYTTGIYPVEITDETPTAFEWSIPKVSGKPIRVSASEWNAFLDAINKVRKYQGMTEAPFTKVRSYTLIGRNVVTKSEAKGIDSRCIISYKNIRQAVDAILGSDDYMGIPIDNEYSAIIDLQKGDNLSAAFFNGLRDALNSSMA